MKLEKRIQIIDWLNSIEKDYDVTALKVGDLHYWPLLRWMLTKKFIEYEKTEDFNNKKVGNRFSLQKIQSLLHGGFNFMLLKLNLIGSYDIILSAAKSHYVNYEGKRVNKLFHLLIQIFNDKKMKILTADYSGFNSEERNRFNLVSAFNFYAQFKGSQLRKVQDPILTKIITKYEKDFQVSFDSIGFKNKINLVLKWAEIYEMLIIACKPKWIFHVCYYNIQAYGLNLACHRQNVKSVEIQHGPQGVLHPAYSGFIKIPEKGYTILPRIFWCWDKLSTKHLDNIFGESSYHSVYHGGHPWMSFISGKSNYKLESQKKKIIVFSLQPLIPIIPEILIDSFDNTPEDYIWWVRVHPRMRTEDITNLTTKLKVYLDKGTIEIDRASNLPLPEVLALASVHVTRSSGCFIEATLMGVPNIIIDELGALYYKEFIDNEKNFVQTEGNIWRKIKAVSQVSMKKEQDEDIEEKLNELLKMN